MQVMGFVRISLWRFHPQNPFFS